MRKDNSEEIRPEYRREDLGLGVRGKYLEAYRAGRNLILLRPDGIKAFLRCVEAKWSTIS